MSIKLQLPLARENRLVRWANAIRGFYGGPVYLVGSQITGSDKPRDVDVICVISDDDFAMRYGNVQQFIEEGENGLWTEVRWAWSDDCIKKWRHGVKATGLNLDFKVQPQTQFDGYKNIHERFPPYKLDTRD
jgi:hypothetical protein